MSSMKTNMTFGFAPMPVRVQKSDKKNAFEIGFILENLMINGCFFNREKSFCFIILYVFIEIIVFLIIPNPTVK